MIIRLEHLIPIPMMEQETGDSEIWEKESVEFEQGNSYVIQAPSGQGKTSLLSVIYGIRDDYRGRVTVDEQDISGWSWKQWSLVRKKQFSFIFQGLQLFPELTALDNILLKNSITRHQTEARIREMAGEMGMEPFLSRKAGILSFGQQQRTAILRSLCQPFRFLLADECFSHIDRENSDRCFQVIRRECEAQGAGLILTTLNGMGSTEGQIQFRL